jgi:hypothetical protein
LAQVCWNSQGRSAKRFFPKGIFARLKAIADTGFLVALARDRDRYHNWAIEIGPQISWPMLTCEAVLAETACHIQSSADVFGMLQDGMVRIAFDCASHLNHLLDLASRYADRKPDLADLCPIRMSELYPRHTIITVDEDFRVYRRNKREAIPLLCPPKK